MCVCVDLIFYGVDESAKRWEAQVGGTRTRKVFRLK